uniref:Uncharacterized protein n=1 Tax=Meloidogyne hapla TaxID=6305 RepID=A0A1I8BJK5_MELHA
MSESNKENDPFENTSTNEEKGKWHFLKLEITCEPVKTSNDKWANVIYHDDEEDESDEPEKDEIIELGKDEEEYKLRHERDEERRYHKTVPQQLLVQADMLKNPRKGIFVHQCNKCKEHQMRREEYLFKGGASGIFVLTIEMCGDDLDKNIALSDFYGQSWGEGSKEKTKEFEEGGSQTKTSFEKVAGVLCYTLGNSCQSDGDRKLLRYKCAWIIHQVKT